MKCYELLSNSISKITYRAVSKSSAGSQGGFDLSDQGIVDDHARFEMQRPDLKNTLLAVGFGIDATDQRIVVQDRQGEVAIFAFGRGYVACTERTDMGCWQARQVCCRPVR